MGTIRSGVGLISGINTNELVQNLIALQRAPVVRLQQRVTTLQTKETALKALEANLLTLKTALVDLGDDDTFSRFNITNSDAAQLTATAATNALPGTYKFQTLRTASTYQALSKGYANADQQTIGTGTLVIQNGGGLQRRTTLDALNGGNGVQRGVIRITDRAGNSADIDLSDTYTVEDVLDAINNAAGIAVTATTHRGHLVLTDNTGATLSDLSVTDLNGGQTAADLGLNKSVSANTLTGDDVFTLTGEFTLDQLNDGNGIRRLKGAPDLRITTADGTQLEINLDNAFNLNDVLSVINTDANNTGKVTAALVDGRLQLTDNTSGSSTFQIEDINGTSVVEALGLDVTAAGNVLSGRKLLAGINSVLLHNLRGGEGIDSVGQLALTDRSGTSATVDLTGAESLDEVIYAINTATSTGGVKLQLQARVNEAGTGLEIVDTSGATASNLIIADVGGSTLAAQLGIAVDAAQNSVNSGPLNRRYLNEASSLSNYAPDGKSVSTGQIRIVDSAGNSDIVEITSAVQNIGDVLQRINAAANIQVQAELNDTGDGFVLIDQAGGSGTLKVEEVDSDTAADLRLLGNSVVGTDGKQRISSRFAAVIEVDATDTLNDLVTKINETASGFVTASVFDDGSAFNSQRLMLTASRSGYAGRLFLDDSGLNLGLAATTNGDDALLKIGEGTSAFVVASDDNHFDNAATGIDVDVLSAASSPAEVVVSRDDSAIESALQKFVDGFNTFVKAAADQTKFDPVTNERGTLQGENIVLRARSRLDNLVLRQFSGFDGISSLQDLGIRSRADGTLEFNTDRLQSALQDNREAVRDFILREEDGFADVAEAVLDTLTDPVEGTFALEANSLEQSVEAINDRIAVLEEILLARQERLFRQFANMEDALGALLTQQQAIAGIQPLSINPIATGIL